MGALGRVCCFYLKGTGGEELTRYVCVCVCLLLGMECGLCRVPLCPPCVSMCVWLCMRPYLCVHCSLRFRVRVSPMREMAHFPFPPSPPSFPLPFFSLSPFPLSPSLPMPPPLIKEGGRGL